MNKFVNAVKNPAKSNPVIARTTNGMRAYTDTSNVHVDLYYAIGASRGKDIIPLFEKAYKKDSELAVRIALWVRDIREGAGERKLFRDILKWVSINDPDMAARMSMRTPDLGRWDDLFVIENADVRHLAFSQIGQALREGNALCAKWMPRKGEVAIELREFLGMSPRRYRKTLVEITNVVETKMCAKDWDSINFNHVPSVASSRYKKAFNRHTEKYKEWLASLVKNKEAKIKDPKIKVNASAIYPYDVIKGLAFSRLGQKFSSTELGVIEQQWDALPNYIGDAKVMPLVDVSGSMTSPVGNGITALDVAISLGLYCSDKNTGAFKDLFLTFSSNPQFVSVKGAIVDKIRQMANSEWSMSTDLNRAIDKILDVAVKNRVPVEDMPDALLIMSDMQFNQCVSFDDTTMNMIRRKYENAGYEFPAIVFWNINSRENAPVKANQSGVALVSGFSPSIMKSVLTNDYSDMTPKGVMMKTIMNKRYDLPPLNDVDEEEEKVETKKKPKPVVRVKAGSKKRSA